MLTLVTNKKVSFVNTKSNKTSCVCVCNCKKSKLFSCDLHDGSNELNSKVYGLIEKYFVKYNFFNEKDVIEYVENVCVNYDIISFFIMYIIDIIKRLEARKQEIFEENLISCLNRRIEKEQKKIPRIVRSEDFDPEWSRFISKWDNINIDIISCRKQRKEIKISIIKGGSRDFDGTLTYLNITLMQNLIIILEKTRAIIFGSSQ